MSFPYAMRRLGDGIRIVGNRNSSPSDINENLLRLLLRQGPSTLITRLAAKLSGESLGKMRSHVLSGLHESRISRGARIGGTIAQGAKGKRVYLNRRTFTDPDFLANAGGLTPRGVVHHEIFHQKVPVLGHSEILAHAYGGLRAHKGELSPGVALRQIGHLGRTRPSRLGLELGLGGAGVYGANAALFGDESPKRSRALPPKGQLKVAYERGIRAARHHLRNAAVDTATGVGAVSSASALHGDVDNSDVAAGAGAGFGGFLGSNALHQYLRSNSKFLEGAANEMQYDKSIPFDEALAQTRKAHPIRSKIRDLDFKIPYSAYKWALMAPGAVAGYHAVRALQD